MEEEKRRQLAIWKHIKENCKSVKKCLTAKTADVESISSEKP